MRLSLAQIHTGPRGGRYVWVSRDGAGSGDGDPASMRRRYLSRFETGAGAGAGAGAGEMRPPYAKSVRSKEFGPIKEKLRLTRYIGGACQKTTKESCDESKDVCAWKYASFIGYAGSCKTTLTVGALTDVVEKLLARSAEANVRDTLGRDVLVFMAKYYNIPVRGWRDLADRKKGSEVRGLLREKLATLRGDALWPTLRLVGLDDTAQLGKALAAARKTQTHARRTVFTFVVLLLLVANQSLLTRAGTGAETGALVGFGVPRVGLPSASAWASGLGLGSGAGSGAGPTDSKSGLLRVPDWLGAELKTAERFNAADRLENICVSCIPVVASGIPENRVKVASSTKEGQYRLDHARELQLARWDWYQNNIETFTNMLRENGYHDGEIKELIAREKPLGFDSVAEFERFKADIAAAVRQIESTTPVRNIQVVLQGSNITGFSTNPRKGSREIPDYLYSKSKGSDMDLRIYGDNLDEYVAFLKGAGVAIGNKEGGDRGHLVEPDAIELVFPQFTPLISRSQGGLQVTAFTEDRGFQANPWDMRLEVAH